MIEFEHSPLGGSGASRWLTCGNSFLLQRLLMLHGEYEQPPSSTFADKGTAAHELGAACLTEGKEPFEYIGQKFGRYEVSPDDLDPDAVAVYVATCEAIVASNRGLNYPVGGALIEETIHLPDIHPLLKGTVDFGHWRLAGSINPGLWLIDYKNGEGVGVNAYRNPQMLYYAFLLIASRTILWTAPDDFPVYLGIVQPNYFGMFTEPETWITTAGEVRAWGRNVLLPAMERLTDDKRTMLPEDEFVDGDHCQFCPVMLDCPKLKHAFTTYAHGEDFLEMLSDQELSDLYRLRDGARRYGNELEKVAFARLLGGKELPSAKLVEKLTHRVFKAGAEGAAVQKFGDNAYNPKKLKSPAQIEKLSTDGKAFALEWGYKPDSDRLTVAPITDRRPTATPKSNEVIFQNFAVPLEDLGW